MHVLEIARSGKPRTRLPYASLDEAQKALGTIATKHLDNIGGWNGRKGEVRVGDNYFKARGLTLRIEGEN